MEILFLIIVCRELRYVVQSIFLMEWIVSQISADDKLIRMYLHKLQTELTACSHTYSLAAQLLGHQALTDLLDWSVVNS